MTMSGPGYYPATRTGKGFVSIDLDDLIINRIEGVKHEFPAIMRLAQEKAGSEIVLPRLRALSPHVIRDTMIVKVRFQGDSLALTTRATNKGNPPRAVVAFLNWGGVIHAELHPTKHRALRLKSGAFVMSVKRGRKNRHPRYFMELARAQALGPYSTRVGEIIGEELTKRFT